MEQTQNVNSQQAKKSWFLRHKILTIILVLVVLFLMGSAFDEENNSSDNRTSNSRSEAIEDIIEISARELYAAYDENEIKADDLYKDRLLEVSGVINDIGKDILDNPYITLKTDNPIGSIQCMLADSEKSKASQLKKGLSVVVEGKNDGLLMNVLLRNCQIK